MTTSNSLINPTSDFEEELSSSDICGEDDRQVLDIVVSVHGREVKTVSVLITRQGVAKVFSDTLSQQSSGQLAKVRKTIIPIQVGGKPFNQNNNNNNSTRTAGRVKQQHQSTVESSSVEEVLQEVASSSDLASSLSSSCLASPASQEETTATSASSYFGSRILSPIKISYLENRPALVRQKTFTESACQTLLDAVNAASTDQATEAKVDLNSSDTQTDLWNKQQEDRAAQTDSLTDNLVSCPTCIGRADLVEASIQTLDNATETFGAAPELSISALSPPEMPTDVPSAPELPIAAVAESTYPQLAVDAVKQDSTYSTDALVQTDQPCYKGGEPSFPAILPENSSCTTQTEQPTLIDTEIQTSPQQEELAEASQPSKPSDSYSSFVVFPVRSPSVKSSSSSKSEQAIVERKPVGSSQPSSRQSTPQGSIDRTNTFVKPSLTDEIVSRVLLEHVDEEDELEEAEAGLILVEEKPYCGVRRLICPKSSESDPGATRGSARSITDFSVDGSKALSDNNYKEWNDLLKLPIDISRSVNYMDLSKLGNEGETPNSEEMWVNVEDDNKFLTSDTETYSVATDKVSTMATFRGHAVGANNPDLLNMMRSVSEAELLETGNDSLLSETDGQQYGGQDLASIFRNEMEPIKECLNNADQTMSGIAGTLCSIQDGVSSLCCNITQIKSKVLSSGMDETSLFSNDSIQQLEIIKNGKPNGDTNELVDMIMAKLEKILTLRDSQLEKLIQNLKEDNTYLRKELEEYRIRDSSEMKLNNELEFKMQEVIDNMKSLKDGQALSSSTSSGVLQDVKQREGRRKVRKRSKSKATSDASNGRLRQRSRQNLDDFTSSDEGSENYVKLTASPHAAASPKVSLIDTEQQTVDIDHFSREMQTMNLFTKETGTITDLDNKFNDNFISAAEKIDNTIKVNPEMQSNVIQKESLANKKEVEEIADKQVENSRPMTKKQKNEKHNSKSDEKKSKPKNKKETNDKKPKLKEKTQESKQKTHEEDIDKKVDTDVQKVNINKECEESKLNDGVENLALTSQKPQATSRKDDKKFKENIPSTNVQQTNGKQTNAKGETKQKEKSKSLERSKSLKLKDTNGKDSKDKKKKTKTSVNESNMKKAASESNIPAQSSTISKVIEGDDFRITITSNQELASCELSDLEDPKSPRKKIIVTPKPPAKGDTKGEKRGDKELKDETIKKGGKIPISKQYIKQKTKVPAPEQFPVARPPAAQIPTPSLPSSCMSPSVPISVDISGYNHNLPPSPTHDYSICSNTYPISGRNTQMSMEEFTMMIKQDSRDSNVYDAPSSIPDYLNEVRESPDGAYSYVLDGRIRSSMSNISDLKYDLDEVESESLERDMLMEFVQMEERMERTSFKRNSPFRGYTERIKRRMMREIVNTNPGGHQNSNGAHFGSNVQPIPLPARKAQRRKLWKTRSQSVSNEKLTKIKSSLESARELIQSKRNCFSTDRLPNLTSAEEERIVKIKKYEDETERLNESRRHYNLRRITKDAMKNKILPDKDIIIYEKSRPATSTNDDTTNTSDTREPDSGIESQGSKESFSDAHFKDCPSDNSTSGKEQRMAKLEPMDRQSRTVLSPDFPPLMVECFIVSRGWTVDQAQLTKALAKLEGINFVRMQVANTMNRVLENIR